MGLVYFPTFGGFVYGKSAGKYAIVSWMVWE